MENDKKTPVLLDALGYPFLRIGWLIVIVACVGGILGLLSLQILSTRILLVVVLLSGVILRCYFSIIETTVTGWGREAWQGSGLNMEGLWPTLFATVGVAAIAWLPAILVSFIVDPHEEYADWVSGLLAAFGCEYFCMGILALVAFGSFSETLPQRVLPALMRAGPNYLLAGICLMAVPTSTAYVFESLRASEIGVVASALSAAATGAFLLMSHARLIGLLYLENVKRIGWAE